MEVQLPYVVDGAVDKVVVPPDINSFGKVEEVSKNYNVTKEDEEIIIEGFLASVRACQRQAEENGIKKLSQKEFDELVYE
uniref:Uncharacterized protein n=1 Tax=Candidatus Kentrum sp. FM TaxID=2126340 RepID=A0A450SMP1_9GAMM|nr:MAG: hypothetical protein BECKFM1743A_GA0114220_100099 [Candidatus Kentron sp. FM]VFJ55063.1 MAG: hypothetical protein BECKFM1743C_GA0114222_101504 [Candidatus Kentron sp. FM]VFK07181.1 MAG: hypothetical protein BECKFM1743B_GA0114221_100344 [Candidatus Kentron sp. FM]